MVQAEQLLDGLSGLLGGPHDAQHPDEVAGQLGILLGVPGHACVKGGSASRMKLSESVGLCAVTFMGGGTFTENRMARWLNSLAASQLPLRVEYGDRGMNEYSLLDLQHAAAGDDRLRETVARPHHLVLGLAKQAAHLPLLHPHILLT